MVDREGVARRYYESLDSHDYETLRDLLTPSFVHERPDRTIDGRDRFVQFMRDQRPQTDTSHPVDAVYENPGGIAVQGRLLSADGDRIAAFVDVFAFEGDSIAAITTYTE